MLKKHPLSDAAKTPGAEKALFGCWKSSLCSKKTFSMPKKSAALWQAQLNYAVLRAEAALATGGSAEGIAGDQLCIWNTIAPDAIIPSTHLTLFLPPSLGAYVMANHQSHREFKPHPSSSASDIPTFTVQQGLHFPLPEVLKNQVELLNMARYAAADGYITPAAIPLLSHSLTGEHMTFQKIKWSLPLAYSRSFRP